jgi:hypothetical protein
MTLFGIKKKCKYANLDVGKKMLLKIENENLLPKGGGSDQPSLGHKVFLHYFITKKRVNVPKYIFKYMIKQIKESQTKNRYWVPYERLISKIFHQGGILNALSKVQFYSDAQLCPSDG